ncbi:MFS transporter [Microbacterium sp.]|uniref:MFS transporter n=1 Tax=Microbacterium sp. TaxID=51671 RepID=UPI003F9B5932
MTATHERPRRNSRLLVASSFASNLGDGFQLTVIPLLAALWTNDLLITGLIAAVRVVPAIVMALPLGVIADRTNRAGALVIAVWSRAVLAVALVACLASGFESWLILLAVSALFGILEVLYDTNATAIVPELVEDARLEKVNARISLTQTVGNGIIGPVLGASLFVLSPSAPFLINAFLLLASGALLVPVLRRGRARATPVATPGGTGFARELTSGLSIIFRDRLLTSLLILGAGWNLLGWLPEGPLVFHARDELGLDAAGFALLLACSSTGAVIGGLAASWIRDTRFRIVILCVSTPLYGLLFLLVAFTSNPVLVGAYFLLQGLPLILYSVYAVSIRQRAVDNKALGRVSSVFVLVSVGVTPLSLTLGSWLASMIGTRAVFAISGASLTVFGLLIVVLLIRYASLFDRMKTLSTPRPTPTN